MTAKNKNNFQAKTLFVCAVLLCISFFANAQNSDSTYLATLNIELSLGEKQFQIIDSIYRTASQQITAIDKNIMRSAREAMTMEEKDKKVADLQQQKKTLRETRDLSIQLLLTADQKKIYDERIKPAKPAVLHMGMNHDRANCTVCVPK